MTASDIYTVAGSSSGASGHTGDGGAATSALLESPDAIAVDAAGNLYIADAGNNRAQFVAAASCSSSCPLGLSSTTANDIYTVAGSATGTVGSSGDGGAASSALLDDIAGVAVDSAGNLYIADTDNNRVQFVAASSCSSSCPWGLSSTTKGDIYTVAGSASGSSGEAGGRGPATSALLDTVTGVALDSSGNLLVADTYNFEVELVPSTGCAAGCLWGPLATTAGHIYSVAGSVAGAEGHSGDSGPATDALLGQVDDVVADPSGNLYIADTSNNRVQEVAATTGTQWGISMTAGDTYTIAGSSTGTAGSSGDGGAATSALLSAPTGLALDSVGDLFIADQANNRVREVAASTHTQWGTSMTAGDIYTVAGTGTAGYSGDGGAATSARLDLPTGVAVDAGGDLYIADQDNNRAQEVAATTHTQWGQSMSAADIYTVAGSATGSTGHSGDGGAATSSLLKEPYAVALDSSGDLYIADTDNNRVQFVAASTCSSSCPFGLSSTTAGDVYTIAGSGSGSSGSTGDGGAATSALLSAPSGVALDPTGNLYIADAGNNRAQFVAAKTCSSSCAWGLTATTAGYVYTVASSATAAQGHAGIGGLATSALLDAPAGVGLDSSGNLYLADTYNYEVDEVPAASGSPATSSASYTYNGDGLEAARTANGTVSQLEWAPLAVSPLPVVISDGANDYVYGPAGEPVEQISLTTSTPTYLAYTSSGSSWLSTNQAGDETGFWRYDAFGTLAYGTPTSPFGYSGQYTDATTGLVNDRARWYQGQTGEFTTRDPAFASTGTAYTYAGDDPVDEDDPNGLSPALGPPQACDLGLPDIICVPVPYVFANWQTAETVVEATYTGALHQRFLLWNGQTRIVDVYVRSLTLAIEVKIGRQSLSNGIQGTRQQIANDQLLRTQYCAGYRGFNPVCTVMWTFWPSEASGTRPSTPLVRALSGARIPALIFYLEVGSASDTVPEYEYGYAAAGALAAAGAVGATITLGDLGELIIDLLATFASSEQPAC